MNSLIEELKKQAGAADYYGGMECMDVDKFAALLVRECTRVIIETQTENDMNNVISKNPGKEFSYALIKHFGIK